MRIICFGDSVTEGRSISSPPEPAEYVHQPEDRWPAILQELLIEEPGQEIEVINLGIGGNTTADALARLESDVLPHLPGVVILEFGFNDALFLKGWSAPPVDPAQFLANLQTIIARIREKSALPIVLILNHPSRFIHAQENGRPLEENLIAYRKAAQQVPEENGVHRLDLTETWGESPQHADFLCWDGLHLTADGNRHYAQKVADFLKPILCDIPRPSGRLYPSEK